MRRFQKKNIAAPLTRPQSAGITLGPWLCNPDAGVMGIRFLTAPNTAGGIEYRQKGECEWKQLWNARHGQIERSDNHNYLLQNLVPGATYEYRPVICAAPEVVEKREEEIYSFRVPDMQKETFSFLFTADLQYPRDVQKEYIQAMFDAADAATCDFIVLGGDIVEFSDIRNDLLYEPIQDIIEYGCDEKPLIYVRGNHELRGVEAYCFSDYFAFPDGRTYGTFRFGNTAFLVLDCWEDKPASSNTDYTHFNLDREFLREEKAFLLKALTSDQWCNAKRRIVLAHGAAYSNRDDCLWQPFRIQKLTDEFFHGKNPVSTLDLWLCGHSHVHLRSCPGSNELASPVPPPAPHRTGENDIYPVLTVGGPKGDGFPVKASTYRIDVAPDRITARAFNQVGELIDHVIIFDNGTTEELVKVPHFAVPANLEPDAYWSADDAQ